MNPLFNSPISIVAQDDRNSCMGAAGVSPQNFSMTSVEPQVKPSKEPAPGRKAPENGANRPSRPSPAKIALDKKMESLSRQIESVKSRLESLNSNNGLGGNDENKAKRDILRGKIQEVKARQSELDSKKKGPLNELKEAREALKKKFEGLAAAKEKLPFKSAKEIDQKIAALEKSLETQNLKLIEEKKTVNEISKLKKMKRAIEELESQNGETDAIKTKIETARLQVESFDSEASSLKGQLGKLYEELKGLDGDRDEINKIKQANYAKRQQLQEELNKLYEQKKQAFNDFKKDQEEHREKVARERARREELNKIRDQEFKVKDLERTLRSLEFPEFNSQIDKCVQIIKYLQTSFLKEKDLVASEASKPAAASSLNIRQIDSGNMPVGFALPKKGEKEEVLYFGGKAKNKVSAKEAPKAAAAPAATHSSFKLPLHTITGLSELQVSIPSSASDVAACIEALKAKKADYEKKQESRKGEIEIKKATITAELEKERKILEAFGPLPARLKKSNGDDEDDE